MTTALAPRPSGPRPAAPRGSARRAAATRLVALGRQTAVAVRALLVLTLLCGVAYPLVLTGVAQLALPWQANGSLVRADGSRARSVTDTAGSAVVGSELLGQDWTTGAAAATWFHGRPSANNYDGLASGATNLGPNDAGLVATIAERRAALAAEHGLDPAQVPADALTSSASGLDPHVSPAWADAQVATVAEARGVEPARLHALVARLTEGRDLGVLGEPRVDVLRLNIELAHGDW
ncbi:K(+)-transporting ATPase subunit C [Sanguibacter sp. HDW7]|uniref:K(+)-transporting ATPase subunit C n=1 Tax=Sanguibacter sp. HDW7 TaxID=2714931 RepID=UPI00140B645C|nr:K(+)-transporting ATPase subunit C [Sanguibacter sp. HDW7]QIK83775.1 K(+)-transporting ATPase subunit C [Sanguibacter sp. HDW7]